MTVWPNGSTSIPIVTSEYGFRDPIETPGGTSGTFHYGIDLVGFPINRSPFAGQVIFARYNGGAGNEVRVRRSNGDVARIKHNARFLVSEGDWVGEGQDLGVMGTTGTSTGVHCHFETWPGNAYSVNPRAYMGTLAPAGGSASAIIIEQQRARRKSMYWWRFVDNGGALWTVVNIATGIGYQIRDEHNAQTWVPLLGVPGYADTLEQHNTSIALIELLLGNDEEGKPRKIEWR